MEEILKSVWDEKLGVSDSELNDSKRGKKQDKAKNGGLLSSLGKKRRVCQAS